VEDTGSIRKGMQLKISPVLQKKCVTSGHVVVVDMLSPPIRLLNWACVSSALKGVNVLKCIFFFHCVFIFKLPTVFCDYNLLQL